MSSSFIRQVALPGFGISGQRALAQSRVAIVGVGGLGCPVALYLAAAGVGAITLIDGDHVSNSNLPRQVLFGPEDVGRPKVDAALAALARIAPGAALVALRKRLDGSGALQALADHDLVIDATDTFASGFVVADAAGASGIPVVWGAVQGFDGQVAVFLPGSSLRDLVPTQPGLDLDNCEGGAVLGAVCGVVGATMATEAIKVLTGVGEPAAGRVAVYEGRAGRWSNVPLAVPRG